MKRLLITIGAALALFACKPSQDLMRGRAENYYKDHPQEFANGCAAAFPVPKDSIGQAILDSVTPANNIDYTEPLDSLQQLAMALQRRIQSDSTICASTYGAQIKQLNQALTDLKSKYKVCASDTAHKTQPIYRESVGSVAARAALAMDTTAKGRDIAVLKSGTTKLQEDNKKAGNRANMWQIIAFGLIGSWVVYIALRIYKH